MPAPRILTVTAAHLHTRITPEAQAVVRIKLKPLRRFADNIRHRPRPDRTAPHDFTGLIPVEHGIAHLTDDAGQIQIVEHVADETEDPGRSVTALQSTLQ